MTELRKFKVGDRLPVLRGTLTGIPSSVNLATAIAIRLHMKRQDGTVVINAPATIDDAATRRVSYAWGAGETDAAGLFGVEFEVEFPGGLKLTFPNDGDGLIRFVEQIA